MLELIQQSVYISGTTTTRVIARKNYNNTMLIVSITNIMTSLLVIESNKLNDIVVLDDVINNFYESSIYKIAVFN